MRVAKPLAIDLDTALRQRGGHATYIDNGRGEWIGVSMERDLGEVLCKPNEAALALVHFAPDCHDYAKLLEQEKS
jgi:hypothetical protein